MKSRKEVVEYIQSGALEKECTGMKSYWHFGKVELRKLLDFVYEGDPSEDEKLDRVDGGY